MAVRAFSKLMMVGILPLMLGACSGMPGSEWVSARMPWMGVTDDTPKAKDAEKKTSEVASGTDAVPQVDRLSSAPGVVPVPNAVKPTRAELYGMANQSTRNTVQIFSDENLTPSSVPGVEVLPPYNPYDPQPVAVKGIPAASDPRVTIYPLDGVGSMADGPYAQTYLGGGAYNGAGTAVPEYTGPIEGQKQSEVGGGSMPARVFFAHGSAALDANDREVLSQVAEQAKFSPVARVSVEGHASSRVQTQDSVQARLLNLKQSMNRAVAVSNNLIQNGVPPEKIKTTSWGDTRPPMSGSEAEARRVDVYANGGGNN